MSQMLPELGLWHVADWGADRARVDGAPFDVLKLDLRGLGTGAAEGPASGPARGTVRARNLETRLGRIRVTGPDRFVAVYDIRGHRGSVEGTVRPDGSLRLELSGTATGTFVARRADAAAAEPAGADAPSAVAALAGAMGALCRSAGLTRTAA